MNALHTPSAFTGNGNVCIRRSINYGASAISSLWWGNRKVTCFGLHPKDNPEVFRYRTDAEMRPRLCGDVNALFLGESFCGGNILEGWRACLLQSN